MQELFTANSKYFEAMNGFVFSVPKTPEYNAAKKYLDEVVEEIAKRKK